MKERHERDDERLARWIGAVRAEADPALWTRLRARIEAGEAWALPGWLEWMMRPAALGTAAAAVALVCGAGLVTIRSTVSSGGTTATSLTEALLDEVTGSETGVSESAPDASPVDTGAAG